MISRFQGRKHHGFTTGEAEEAILIFDHTMNEDTKNIVTSKTVGANILIPIAVAVIPGAKEWVSENPEATLAIVALINIILRWVTDCGVHLLPKK